MDGWIDGWMDRWIDGKTDSELNDDSFLPVVPENGGQSPAVLLDAGGAAASGSGAGFESSFGAGSSSPVSELRAATPEKAAFLLDAALANRTSQRQSHLKGESGTDGNIMIIQRL